MYPVLHLLRYFPPSPLNKLLAGSAHPSIIALTNTPGDLIRLRIIWGQLTILLGNPESRGKRHDPQLGRSKWLNCISPPKEQKTFKISSPASASAIREARHGRIIMARGWIDRRDRSRRLWVLVSHDLLVRTLSGETHVYAVRCIGWRKGSFYSRP